MTFEKAWKWDISGLVCKSARDLIWLNHRMGNRGNNQ
jgi:hypothetical protein